MLNFDRLFYFPDRGIYGDPADYALRPEEVTFAARDGVRLHGWFFAADGPARGTVIHFHGNAGNLTGHFQSVAWLPGAGWNVLCFDYRGFGRSGGRVSRVGTIHDGHGAVDYVLGRDDVAADRVVIFGQSIGGAIGIVIAAERKEIRGLAAEGAFADYRDMARHVCKQQWWTRPIAGAVSRLFISDGQSPIDAIGRIAPRPVFLFHGTDDEIIPVFMTERLAAAAREPKEVWIIAGGRHTDALFTMPEIARPRLTTFFTRCVERAGTGS